eukprot:scaffold88608_cov24-Cyclotella_meneghiniana.AAC.1
MKEIIYELRSTIRRLTPQLLLQPQQQIIVTATSDEQPLHSNDNVHDELQLEAANELINELASLVWNVDQSWESSLMMATSSSEEKKSNEDDDHHSNKISQPAVTKDQHFEPHTEWNAEAKSIIREGYGLLHHVSTRKTCHHGDNVMKQQEELKSMTRTSILQLLSLVNTTACRHFLLGFLPHFIPLSMNVNHAIDDDDDDVVWSPPRWLQREDDSENYLSRGFHSLNVDENTSSDATIQYSSIEATLQQFLETFESLIQTDPSTLAPFLSTMSLLFDKTNNDPTAIHHDKSSNTQPNSHIHNLYITTRKQCCQLCISSLSSISEHDLPSIEVVSMNDGIRDGSLSEAQLRVEDANLKQAIPHVPIFGLEMRAASLDVVLEIGCSSFTIEFQ